MKKFLFFTLILLIFCSCSLFENKDKQINYAIAAEPKNLDPSLANDLPSLLVIGNVFEGLTRTDENNEVITGLADSWSKSDDGKVYTFTLKDGLFWSDGSTLTAHDIKFGIVRTLLPETASPWAGYFTCIKNALAVYNGQLSPDNLGISVTDERTIVFELERPEPDFLRFLSIPAAYPCKEEFFTGTKGKYGLEDDTILCCGPFFVYRWQHDNRVVLKKNPFHYDADSVVPDTVVLKIADSANHEDLLLNRDIDAAMIKDRSKFSGFDITSFEDTVCGLFFNNKAPTVSNINFRIGLIKAVDTQQIANLESCSPARTLIPPLSKVNGKSYAGSFSGATLYKFNVQSAKQHINSALVELNTSTYPKITLICPDSPKYRALADNMLRSWSYNLNLYVNLQPLSPDELKRKIDSGDYQIALYFLTPENSNPVSMLKNFTSDSAGNIVQYSDDQFDRLILTAKSSFDDSSRLNAIISAEQRLLDSASVFPLFYESRLYACSKNVTGIKFFPFDRTVDFRNAKKN